MITDTTKLLEIIQIINLVLESLAIIIAGWWTYSLFIIQRVKQPHIDTTHHYFLTPITNEKYLLRFTVVLKNHGSVAFKISNIRVWIQQVRPCPLRVLGAVQSNSEPPMTGTEITWPMLADTTAVVGTPINNGEKKLYVEVIEPGETDECYFDFILNNNVQTITAYSSVEAKSGYVKLSNRPNLAWNKTSIWNLFPESKEDEMGRIHLSSGPKFPQSPKIPEPPLPVPDTQGPRKPEPPPDFSPHPIKEDPVIKGPSKPPPDKDNTEYT